MGENLEIWWVLKKFGDVINEEQEELKKDYWK